MIAIVNYDHRDYALQYSDLNLHLKICVNRQTRRIVVQLVGPLKDITKLYLIILKLR